MTNRGAADGPAGGSAATGIAGRDAAGDGVAIYPFHHPHEVPARELAHLLGGKGAGLAEMTAVLGLNVPPGFTLSLPVCREVRETGWPAELDAALRRHVGELGHLMRRRLGDPEDPLLLAVRSGAPMSMPGMLDTVLNLGLNDETVRGLARRSGDDWFAWDSYRRFLRMYATIVMGVPAADLEPIPRTGRPRRPARHVARLSPAGSGAGGAACARRSVRAAPRGGRRGVQVLGLRPGPGLPGQGGHQRGHRDRGERAGHGVREPGP